MDANPEDLPVRLRVRLHVFSITVDWARLGEELAKCGDSRICVLTPHHLLADECGRLAGLARAECEFRTFHDLLDAADMEWCDEEADRLVVASHGGRGGQEDLVSVYYATLTRLKNQRALEKLRAARDVDGGSVLCGDLGIVPEVWCAAGLVDRSEPVDHRRPGMWAKLGRVLAEPMPFHYLDHGDECWLLAGRPSRVGQYLDHGAVSLRPVGMLTRGWLNLVMLMARRLDVDSHLGGWSRRMMSLPWRWRRSRVIRLAAAVHEHSIALAGLAVVLRVEYVNLQDSFLPEYYPSRYLRYRPQVRRFYVWDHFSKGIFNRHGLESAVWGAYRSWTLPLVGPGEWKPVRRIVYLSSGAGDWTALKNRSDEDLALELLIEVAKQRPETTIYYRPHPLWLHPEHQGLNSIQRAINCIAKTGLPNIMVSQGAKVDGRQFSLTGDLSAVSSSVDEDIAWADLVLGEHSQTMLVAARRGKIIAGINVSRHLPYFGDYARVGFPLVTTTGELIALIERLRTPGSSRAFLDEYNAAVRRHNRENCPDAGEPDAGK